MRAFGMFAGRERGVVLAEQLELAGPGECERTGKLSWGRAALAGDFRPDVGACGSVKAINQEVGGMTVSDTPVFGWMKGRVTLTGTDDPAPVALVHDAYGKNIHPCVEVGWWWFPCTEWAYRNLNAKGKHRQGSVTTTVIPAGQANPRSTP